MSELQKPPYSREYNLITFESMFCEQLLQVLNDVITDIDNKHEMDIREEEAEQTVIRLLGMLRIMKYKPPEHLSEVFRQGLVEGDKQVIYPVLEWILQNS